MSIAMAQRLKTLEQQVADLAAQVAQLRASPPAPAPRKPGRPKKHG